MIQEIVTFEKPTVLNPNNVIYWEEESQRLRHDPKQKPTVIKANKFLKARCIEKKSDGEWICKPLKDYNKTTHVIRSYEQGLSCSCQGFYAKKDAHDKGLSEIKPFCSHTVAVKQFCFLEANQ